MTVALAGVIWHNTDQAASYVGCSVSTIRRAVESGELHGGQRKAAGRWRIHRDCLDAWAAGEKCAHQAAAS